MKKNLTLAALTLVFLLGTAFRSSNSVTPVRAQGLDNLVTGSALISFVFGGEQHWEFSASERRDGTVKGQLELFSSQPGGGRLHGSIYCVNSDPSTGIARLGALVTQSTVPLVDVGSFLVWTVQDNGPGAQDATSDLNVVSKGQTDFHCATGFVLPLVLNERGQINVHR